jgi:sRNA-binding protein
MRRIVLVLVLVVVLAIAGYMLLRPKGARARAKSRTALADTSEYAGTSAKAVRPAGSRAARAGKVAGTLKASTKEERRAKAKQIRAEERARKRELKRQAREKKRMLSRAARGRRGRSTRRGGQLYVLKAVVVLASENYALVDGRKVQVGDFVLGRKIVGISPDRIEIEAFGKRSTVRVGESLLPSSYAPTTRR